MLVNCKYKEDLHHEAIQWLETCTVNPEPGIYCTTSGSWDSWVKVKWFHEFKLTELYGDRDNFVASYGVVDDINQWKNLYQKLIDDPERKYCVEFNPFWKENEEPRGWRWAKWGPYLGTQNPQADYLYDEPEIKMILCFQVHEIDD